MTPERMFTQIRLCMCAGNGYKRAEYARRKGIYAEIGEGSTIPMSLPLYPELVRIHDHVIMHRTVKLMTHDLINGFLSEISDDYQFKNAEIPLAIEIMDNVFIGMDTIVLGNVRIGSDVIINAGSLVANDIPPNSIAGGGTGESYRQSR